MQTITDLGEIGSIGGGILRPLDFTMERDGSVWNLTGYAAPELRVWDARTHTIVAINGTGSIVTPASGIIRYTPGVTDPIYGDSGTFEARWWLDDQSGGDPEPSSLFRFSIGGGPPPA